MLGSWLNWTCLKRSPSKVFKWYRLQLTVSADERITCSNCPMPLKVVAIRSFGQKALCWSKESAELNSQTSSECSSRNRSIYKNVAWTNSESKDATIANFQELSNILKLCPPGGGSVDPKQLAPGIYRHASQHVESPLLVFGNAVVLKTDGEQFGILDWLPTVQLDRYPQIITTSQSTEWKPLNMKKILLEPLETVDFCNNYFKLNGRVLDEELQQQLEVLSALVQGLPLWPWSFQHPAWNSIQTGTLWMC